MRGFYKKPDWPGLIKIELSPGNFIYVISEVMITVENAGSFLEVQVLNQENMGPLVFFGADSWLVSHSWVHEHLEHPGIIVIPEREIITMTRQRSGQ